MTGKSESAEKEKFKEKFKKKFDLRDKKYPSLDSLRKSKPQDPLDTPKIMVSKSPEFKSPSQRRAEKKAETREQRITLKDIGMAKGGRAGYKSGGRGCKLAMKGKGRAYGKNS